MNINDIKYCPGSLKPNQSSYSRATLNRLFNGKKVSHILPYDSPFNQEVDNTIFVENQKRISISGVQQKYSLLQEKNQLRLIDDGEQGTHILKPIPNFGKRANQMPANEHLTMQIASQIFGLETAENGLIFFQNGEPAYITKRFDVNEDGAKLAQEDFASLANRTPQTHGTDFKYLGSYLELFEILKKYVPAYTVESVKLFKLIAFNYLFSNGDAHFKNFSLIETSLGDFKLSPAYDLLNSRIHIEDKDFALSDGLLPANKRKGKIQEQLNVLAKEANIMEKQANKVIGSLLQSVNKVEELISYSYMDESTKRNYLQAYQTRHKRLQKL